MIDTVFSVEEIFTEKQLLALRDMLFAYKEFQLELYNYPKENTLFTKTQLELFSIFNVDD